MNINEYKWMNLIIFSRLDKNKILKVLSGKAFSYYHFFCVFLEFNGETIMDKGFNHLPL